MLLSVFGSKTGKVRNVPLIKVMHDDKPVLVASMGGNAGMQTLAVTIRTIATNELTKNNFNILIAQNNIKIKELDLSKEKSSNRPTLDITASTEYSDGSRIDAGSENTNATIGLTLTIPIFQQNIDKSDIRKINSQILQT